MHVIPPSQRVLSVEYAIRDVLAAAKALEKKGKKIYYLNIGDPNKFDFIPPAHVLKAFADAVMDPKYSCYAPSEGDPELREAIAKREGVTAEDIMVTAGMSEGISFLFASLLNPGDNILQPSPSYPLYMTMSRFYDGKDNFYRCNGNWLPDVDDMRKKINSRTRAIVLINPNNPTGAVYDRKKIKEIADLAGEHGISIISDEIYDKLIFEGEVVHTKDVARDIPVISGNGISKVYLYPGARGGYLAFHGEALREVREGVARLCRARLCSNHPVQRAMLAAFTGPQDHLKDAIRKMRERRDIIHKRLNEIRGLGCVKPAAAFYALPKFEDEKGIWKDDKEFVNDLLNTTGVLAVPGSGFSPILEKKYFRIVYLAQPEVLHEVMNLLERFMKTRG